MADRIALIILFTVIAVGYLILFAISRRKQREQRVFLARMDDRFRSLGAESLGDGAYRWDGRVYTLQADPTPFLKRKISLRLAALAPGTVEFELKRAENVPLEMPDRLREHAFYRDYVVPEGVTPELEAYLLQPDIVAALAGVLPERWNGCSHHFVERVLYENVISQETYGEEDLQRDLNALAVLCRTPLERIDRIDRLTVRHGFEKNPPVWHWPSEDRLRWAEHLTRSCISAYHGSPLLNGPLLRIFRRLAGPGTLLFLMNDAPPEQIGLAYGPAAPRISGLVAECSDAVAIAADAFTDAAFFGALVAVTPDRVDAVRSEFAEVPPYDRHPRLLKRLPDLLFYVRRLRDDEDSWFAGEYEILSQQIGHSQVEDAVRQTAAEVGAPVAPIDRPFSPKLYKDDRLEMAP